MVEWSAEMLLQLFISDTYFSLVLFVLKQSLIWLTSHPTQIILKFWRWEGIWGKPDKIKIKYMDALPLNDSMFTHHIAGENILNEKPVYDMAPV